ncbi:porin family protein [Aquimarina algicola]|uniref:PorT family protein n=1 Tax=Aquimarina algicola TaxID=2589995 RepID=A0A504JHF5_9FLAO|nr:hypothetical protein [Aquimarina algicola]TPN85871.1 hypothetical protein FHK87_11345 [Aquimarina algicola]
MKTIVTLATIVVMSFLVQLTNAQEREINSELELLEQQKEQIVLQEKEALKQKVEKINDQLINKEITIEEAQRQKENAAKTHALNIENKIAIIDNQIALIQRNGIESDQEEDPEVWIGVGAKSKNSNDILFGIKINPDKEKEIKYDRRTTSHLVIATGFNNAISEDKGFDDLDYKGAGSRFFEIGWVWKTRVFKNTNFLRLKYGLSYTNNGLKPEGNRYFVESNNQVRLEEFRVELSKSKFRMDNLVIPVHFEFGPSELTETAQSIRYSTEYKFIFGIGGYAGFNLSTRQKLKYRENGERIKDKIKRDYNTSDIVYGISGYIGCGDLSLYAKYDLSPIFEDAEIEQNNISLGLRIEL